MRNAALRNFTYKRFKTLWGKITNYDWQKLGSRKSPSKVSINSDLAKETTHFTTPTEPNNENLDEKVEKRPQV